MDLIANSISIAPKILYFGTPVVLLSTRNPDGTANLSPLSSAWALDDRVVLGLGALGQALSNIERERQCVINLPSPELWRAVERLAPTTGRAEVPASKRRMGYRFVANKFGESGMTPIPSETVRPPRVAECPLQLEARVVALHRSRSEREAESFAIVETQVTRVHAHASIVHAGTSYIDVDAWRPLFYVFRHYFSTGPELGRNFRAEGPSAHAR